MLYRRSGIEFAILLSDGIRRVRNITVLHRDLASAVICPVPFGEALCSSEVQEGREGEL
jgi:hypothetical protein